MASPAAPRSLMLPVIVLGISIALLAGALGLTFFGRDTRAPAPSVIGGPFQLINQNGQMVTQEDFKGQPTLFFFGYTHCPDVCPTTLFEISEVFRKLGPNSKVRAVFVTVDPERDTPDLLKSYLSSFDKRISGLTGERPALDAMLKEWRVYSKKTQVEGDAYTMDHSAIVYLMDSQLRFVNALPLQDQARAIGEIQRWM
jgi:protein SCO1/2